MAPKSKAGGAAEGKIIRLAKAHFARVLYTNPVCLLTSNLPPLAATVAAAAAAAAKPAASIAPTATAAPPTLQPAAAAGATAASSGGSAGSGSGGPVRRRNVMTISWLTATSNYGDIMLSMNASRYSATLVTQTRRFVLNVPVSGMESTIRSIGGCSGFDCDKFADLKLNVCRPDWTPLPSADTEPTLAVAAPSPAAGGDVKTPATATSFAATASMTDSKSQQQPNQKKRKAGSGGSEEDARIDAESEAAGDFALADGCAAHMIVTIQHIITPPPQQPRSAAAASQAAPTAPTAGGAAPAPYGVAGHLLLFGRVEACWIRSEYWSGNTFIPQPIPLDTPPSAAATGNRGSLDSAPSPAVRYPPPYLTFLGSSQFALVQRYDEPPQSAADGSTANQQ